MTSLKLIAFIKPHPDGGWFVVARESEGDVQFVGHDGRGLTKDEAEELLDRLYAFVAERN